MVFRNLFTRNLITLFMFTKKTLTLFNECLLLKERCNKVELTFLYVLNNQIYMPNAF